jgi:hypothetical protein
LFIGTADNGGYGGVGGFEMDRVIRGLVGLALMVLLGATCAYAQATAQITGVVSDMQGAVLPGVDVTAIQTETGFKRSTVTDANGLYTLTNLPVGPYRVEAMLSGFRAFVRTGLVLQVNANPVVNVTMALGNLSETIAVEAATPLIETRSPSIGTVIENERIEELPLNGRQATDLIVLAGAAVQPPGSGATSRSMSGGVGISVAGGQTFGVAYLLDGASHNNPYDNLNLPLPFPDAMQEFRVETSSTNANNGMHSGASVNAVTKSGTNAYHGDLFEFFRNHRFNATDPFARVDPETGKRVDDGLNRNQFGATFGGPIRRDRLFFFGAYQGTKFRSTPSDLEAFVPTERMLNGDFTIFNSPACRPLLPGGLPSPVVPMRPPFVNNRVDPSLISPAARAISAHLPKPQDECGRVQYESTRPQDDHQYIGKVDLQLSSNHSMFGRYMLTNVEITPPLNVNSDNILVSNLGGNSQYAHSLTIGDTRVLSNSTVNSLRVAGNYTNIHRIHAPIGFDVRDVGINSFSYLEDYMLLSVSGGFTLGGGTESEALFKTPSYLVSDDLTMIRGNHQFGLGGSLGYWRSLSRANVRSPGQFSFGGGNTGIGLGDFVIGRLSAAGLNPAFIQAVPNTLDMEQWYVGLYGQDTWKASPRLTVNYGLRWEPAIAQQIRNGAIYNFDIDRFLAGQRTTVFTNAPPGFLFPGDPGFVNGNAGMYDHWNQWSPRVGAAFDPTGQGTSVVRGGYALGYDFINAQFHLNTSVAQPWGAEVRLADGQSLDDPFNGSGVANPFPYVLGKDSPFNLFGPYISIPPDIKTPRQQSWNVTFQQQFSGAMAAGVSYLGSYSDRLWNVRSLNEGQYIAGACTLNTPTGLRTFNPCTTAATLNFRRKVTMQNWETGKYLGAVDEHTAIGDQTYHGMLLNVQRRSTAGISVDANYTFSKCEGHPTQGGTTPNVNSGYVNPNDIDYDYGACNSDRRHVFNLTAGYRTPEFDAAALRAIASNWRVNVIYRVSSGAPLIVTVNTDPAGTGIGGQRANLNGDPYGDRDSTTNYLNLASFSAPGPGEYGRQRRGDIYGPGTRNVDIALVRLFRFATHRIEARLESFNLMNWTRYNNPATNFNAANTFGRITTAQDPRIMQFALKYDF